MQERLIRQMRESLGLTQQGFADMLDVSQATVSRWEAGRVQPDAPMRKRIHDLVRDRGGLADGPLLSMIRQTPAIAALFDLDMRVLAISEQAAAVNGIRPNDAIGMNYRDRFTPDLEEAYEAAIEAGFFLGRGLGLEVICKTNGLRDGLEFNAISTWHLLPRPSTGQPLLAWTARFVDEAEFNAALTHGRIKVLTDEDWMDADMDAPAPIPDRIPALA